MKTNPLTLRIDGHRKADSIFFIPIGLNVIISSYDSPSIALIQWAFETDVRVDYILQANDRPAVQTQTNQIRNGQKWVESLGIKSFVFPRLANIIHWLNTANIDPEANASIFLPNRLMQKNTEISHYPVEPYFWGEREIHQPLSQCSDITYNQLLLRAGFELSAYERTSC